MACKTTSTVNTGGNATLQPTSVRKMSPSWPAIKAGDGGAGAELLDEHLSRARELLVGALCGSPVRRRPAVLGAPSPRE